MIRATTVTLAAALTFAFLPRAAPAATMMPAGCDAAKAHMATMPAMPKATGNPDHDFAAMAMAHDKMMMAMANMEAACGKDPKERDMARKMAEATQVQITDITPYLRINF